MRKGMGFCTGCRKADELMEKKHEFKFNIGLNQKNPDHVRVAEILNRLGRGKAEYVVKAVLAYENQGVESVSGVAVSYEELENLVRRILKEQASGKTGGGEKQFEVAETEGKRLDEQDRKSGELDSDDMGDVLKALAGFRGSV